MSIHMSILVSIHMSIHMSMNMSMRIIIHMSIHMSMRMSMCMSIHTSMRMDVTTRYVFTRDLVLQRGGVMQQRPTSRQSPLSSGKNTPNSLPGAAGFHTCPCTCPCTCPYAWLASLERGAPAPPPSLAPHPIAPLGVYP